MSPYARTVLVCLLGCNVALTAWLGWSDTAFGFDLKIRSGELTKVNSQAPDETVREMGPNLPEQKDQSRQSEEKETAVEPAAESAASEAKPTPLEDFKPTEKIAADTAVDFPADI